MKKLSLIIISLLVTLNMFSQLINNCPNLDLSMGNFTNWVGFTGQPPNGGCCPINTPIVGIVANRHVVTNAPGTDVTQGGFVAALSNTPPGYQRAARLGNQLTGRQAEALRYTFTPNQNTSLFEYNYAAVLQDVGHSPTQQPRFELQVFNSNGQTIPCTFYQVVASPNVPNWNSQGNIRWRNWTKVGVDLSSNIGTPVTIEARTGDCSLSGHYGYGYIVGSCRPLIITTAYCVGDSVATLIAPDGFISYQWRIQGQPQILSSQQSYIINNPTNGITYEVQISSVSGCVATLSTIVNPVIVYPGFTYTTGCNNLVNFTDTTFILNGFAGNWVWDFGDGNTSTQQNPSHNYAQPGTYQVTLNVASTVGCDSAITLPVIVDSDPIADFLINKNCGLTNQYNDISSFPNNLGVITNWLWNFGDGNTSTSQNPIHTHSQYGTYNITLTVTSSNGCTSSIIKEFTHNPLPTVDFTSSNVCNLDSTNLFDSSTVPLGVGVNNWVWILGDGNISNLQNPSHVYNSPGLYNVGLIVTTDSGCVDTFYSDVIVHPNPNPLFLSNDVCLYDTTVFVNASFIVSGVISQYFWNFGLPNLLNNSFDSSLVYPTHGQYLVTLSAISDMGCIDSISRIVNVWPKPIPDFNSNILSGCYPVSPTFTNTSTIEGGSISDFIWEFGNGVLTSETNPTFSYPNVAGTYSITLIAISNMGCDSTITKVDYITVNPQPIAEFRYIPPFPTIVESTVQFINLSFLGNSYFWNLGDGNFSMVESPNHTYAQDTASYYVTLVTTNQFGCVDSITHKLTIGPTFTIFIPNTFTPNGDGVNDIFKVYGTGITEVNMKIFDRWGLLTFQQGDLKPMNVGWNGGNSPVNGTYVYEIDVRDIFGEWHLIYGKVNITN
jgi:gliding motility-associated-like protein